MSESTPAALNSDDVVAGTLLIRQQLTDLEDQVIELEAQAKHLTASADAREAFVAALRAPRREPVGPTAASSPAKGAPSLAAITSGSPVLLPALAASLEDDDVASEFFSEDVAPEPARAWLLSK